MKHEYAKRTEQNLCNSTRSASKKVLESPLQRALLYLKLRHSTRRDRGRGFQRSQDRRRSYSYEILQEDILLVWSRTIAQYRPQEVFTLARLKISSKSQLSPRESLFQPLHKAD